MDRSGKMLLAKLPEKGLVGLTFWDLGFRNVTNSKQPITKAEDLAGLEASRDSEPGFPGNVSHVQGEPDSDAFL